MTGLHLTPDCPFLVGGDAIAAHAGVHPETALEAMRNGDLVAHQFKARGTWRARPEDVEAWVEGRASAAARKHRRLHATP